MKILIKNFILLFTISYALYAAATAAQFDLPTNQLPNLNMKPSLSLRVDTQTPLPNGVVTATANISGATNINNSNYNWFLNGVKQNASSGIDKNIFVFQVGNLGNVYKVGAAVSTPNGDNLSDSIPLTVGDFDLTWTANSQSPTAYKGKLLPTQNSTISVSTFPLVYRPGTKTQLTNIDLIYNWRVDDKFSSGGSGAGKSDFLLPIFDFAGGSKSIRLEIKTTDGAVSMAKSVEIPIARPQTLIYLADHASNLPFGTALKNLTIAPMKLSFVAQNYFFNAPPSDMKWQWLVDNQEIPSGNPG